MKLLFILISSVSGDLEKEEVYEVPIELPVDISSTQYLKPLVDELAPLNTDISQLLARGLLHRKRKEFLLGYSESPADVMNMILANCAKELSNKNVSYKKTSAFYAQEWVYDAIDRMLHMNPPNVPAVNSSK